MTAETLNEQASSAKGWLIVGVSLALLLGVALLKARA